MSWDNGGVHINSGIPNKAFHLVAMGIGGQAWTTAGRIRYTALQRLVPTSNFQDAADMSVAAATGGDQRVVRDASRQVGITPR